MSNLNKYTDPNELTGKKTSPAEDFFILEKRLELLRKICAELNPFAEISEELKPALREFNLHEIQDPFLLTNRLIMLTEDTIEKLELLKTQTNS